MIAAGPAIWDAASDPNSQPDPMIEPTDVNSRPTKPMSRFSRRPSPVFVPVRPPVGMLAAPTELSFAGWPLQSAIGKAPTPTARSSPLADGPQPRLEPVEVEAPEAAEAVMVGPVEVRRA